jgi:hypothetical protein
MTPIPVSNHTTRFRVPHLALIFSVLLSAFLLAACLPEPPRPLKKASLDTPPAHLDVVRVGEDGEEEAPGRSARSVSKADRSIFLKGEDLSAGLSDDPAFKQLREDKDHDRIARRFAASRADEWGIKDPAKELTLHSVRTDELNTTHVALQQMYRHIPVWNRGVTVHINPSGQVYLVQGRLVPTPEGLNTVPGTGPGEAMAAVGKALPDDADCAACQAEGVIFVSADGPRMAYRVVATPGLSRRRIFFVDAQTGEILKERTGIQRGGGGAGPGSPPAPTEGTVQ